MKSKNRKANEELRENETLVVKENRKKKDREAKSKATTNESSAVRETRQSKEKKAKEELRKKESSVVRVTRQAKDRNAKVESRSNEKPEEREERGKKDKEYKIKSRKKIENSYEARNAQAVLSGKQIVVELKDSDESIGAMNFICPKCSARKWKGETSSTCCIDGKVILERFPDPPPLLKNLWTANTPEARLFRDNSRSFNNGLALASLKVEERKFSGSFAPSVVFEGKVSIRCGPLLPNENEHPRFSQLYVHDPATQNTIRVQNMNLPSSLSSKQKESITKTMKKLQELMLEVNPFVKDFLQICEIPDEEIREGKLVISCKARPEGQHERRYNEYQNLSEVSVLPNSEKGDLVLRKRGGGLQFISDLHPAAQPMQCFHLELKVTMSRKRRKERMVLVP